MQNVKLFKISISIEQVTVQSLSGRKNIWHEEK